LQYRALRFFFAKFEPTQQRVFFDGQQLVCEWVLQFTTRGLPLVISLPTMTVCDVKKEADGLKITRHRDIWSFSSLVQGIPVIGWLHTWQRRLTGSASSYLFRLADKNNNVNKLGNTDVDESQEWQQPPPLHPGEEKGLNPNHGNRQQEIGKGQEWQTVSGAKKEH